MKIDKWHIILFTLLILVCSFFLFSGYNKDLDIKELSNKVKVLTDERDANNKKIAELDKQINKLESDIKERDEKISNINKELDKLKLENNKKVSEIKEKNKEIEKLKEKIKLPKTQKELNELLESLKNNIETIWGN